MLKSDEIVLVSKELVQQFEEINRALDKCSNLALQQPIPNKQIALMTDASFSAAGYALLIEDDPSQKLTSIRKCYGIRKCTGRLRLKYFQLRPYKNVHLCKRIPRNLFRVQSIWAYFLGRAETGHHPNRQQSRHTFFSNQNRTPSPVERL